MSSGWEGTSPAQWALKPGMAEIGACFSGNLQFPGAGVQGQRGWVTPGSPSPARGLTAPSLP